MRRELRVVRSEKVVGAVVVSADGAPSFEGYAAEVLAAFRRRLGDAETAEMVMTDGWSNGYLYFVA